MTGLDVGVILAAIAAVVWVNWYFFLSEPGAAADEVEEERSR